MISQEEFDTESESVDDYSIGKLCGVSEEKKTKLPFNNNFNLHNDPYFDNVLNFDNDPNFDNIRCLPKIISLKGIEGFNNSTPIIEVLIRLLVVLIIIGVCYFAYTKIIINK